MEDSALAMEETALVPLQEPALSEAAQPLLLPAPAGGVKVLPRWAVEDHVLRWRLKYRTMADEELDRQGSDASVDDGRQWVEIELRSFTRELPLTGLEHSVMHYFTVALETPSGWSRWSRIVGMTPPAPELPAKCAAVFANVKDITTAIVRWTRPIDYAAAEPGKAARYRLLVKWTPSQPSAGSAGGAADDAGSMELVIDEDADSCEVPDLRPLRDYTFQVAAANVMGWGEYSDPSPKLNMPPWVPSQLAQPTLRRATHHSVVIQWQHPTNKEVGVDSFRFRWTTSQDWKSNVEELNGVPANLSQHIIHGLTAGQTYLFQVSAVNSYGMGIWSENSLPVKTPDAHVPSKIKRIDVPEKYRSFVTLRWAPAEENGFEVTRHVVRCGHSGDMSDAQEMEPAVERKNGADICNLRHLKKLQYFFQVAACNKMGQSDWSDPVSVDLSSTAPALTAG